VGAVVFSDLFAKLDIQRKSYQSYLISLPLSKWTIFYNDYLFVELLQTIFFITLYTIVYLNGSFNGHLLLLEFFISMLFLACAYYP